MIYRHNFVNIIFYRHFIFFHFNILYLSAIFFLFFYLHRIFISCYYSTAISSFFGIIFLVSLALHLCRFVLNYYELCLNLLFVVKIKINGRISRRRYVQFPKIFNQKIATTYIAISKSDLSSRKDRHFISFMLVIYNCAKVVSYKHGLSFLPRRSRTYTVHSLLTLSVFAPTIR